MNIKTSNHIIFMLQLNSKVKLEENSGIESIRIFHLGQKKRKHGAYASINNIIYNKKYT